jgi:hypothetical protein
MIKGFNFVPEAHRLKRALPEMKRLVFKVGRDCDVPLVSDVILNAVEIYALLRAISAQIDPSKTDTCTWNYYK